MINRPILAAAIAAFATGFSVVAIAAGAQEAPATTTPSTALSLCDIESRLTAQGITIHELELRDLVIEVEGRDGQGRKLEVLVDRRSGEILSRKLDR